MNKVGWIIFGAAVIALLGGLIIWSRLVNPSIDVSAVAINSVLPASEQSGNIADHTLGKADSSVILIEYGDFQCPSCAAVSPQVNTLLDEYGDRIVFVYRNFPLASIHPNARAAAAAAEAAGLQGKYWEYHDALYTNQDSWKNISSSERIETFSNMASQIGVDPATFTTDFASSTVNQKISFDQALGKAKNVSATPTFFLNGKKLNEDTANKFVNGDLSAIKQQLDALLQ